MKGLLLLSSSLLIIGCSKSIDDSLLIDNGGLMYLPNSDNAFTGKAYKNYKNGNTETCNFTNPGADTWHIGIRAYQAFSGLTLTTSYQP